MSPWERLLADMNLSGGFTMGDVWLLIMWVFFLPGNLFIWVQMQFPQWAAFWELTGASYGGWGSGILSFLLWWSAVYAIAAVNKAAK